MKIATFTYTDAKGKITERTVLVTGMPSDKLRGIDLGELTPEEQVDFGNKYNELHDKYLQSLHELQQDFDLTHNYRQFIEKNIANLELEEV